LAKAEFLVDLEVLFSSELKTDPLRLLASLAKAHPIVAVWPGEIGGGRVRYSEAGRADYYESQLPDGAIVLRATSATFPDELPYDLEQR
jgi:hypothetical protein